MNKKEYQVEYHNRNREKIKKQRREYYALNKERIQQLKKDVYNPEKQRNSRLLKQYGITLDAYNLLLISQNNECACCGINQNELKTSNNQFGGKSLVVDHCHVTGNVRTLLCNRCNTVVGMLNEDTVTLNKVGEYIEKWAHKK